MKYYKIIESIRTDAFDVKVKAVFRDDNDPEPYYYSEDGLVIQPEMTHFYSFLEISREEYEQIKENNKD